MWAKSHLTVIYPNKLICVGYRKVEGRSGVILFRFQCKDKVLVILVSFLPYGFDGITMH